MAPKNVLDTVDIFFGTAKAATPEPETTQLQQEISAELDRLEEELSPLQATAEPTDRKPSIDRNDRSRADDCTRAGTENYHRFDGLISCVFVWVFSVVSLSLPTRYLRPA